MFSPYVDKKRNIALDYLKALAVAFVVILHVNGYAAALYKLVNFSPAARIIYIFFEAIAYPSIHLFVLIGSYFMLDRNSTGNNLLRVYTKTLTVTILGLVLALIIIPKQVFIGGVLQSLFPFSQRAYWFVSDYLVLMFASPFLNIICDSTDNNKLIRLTAFLFVLTCVLPFISVVAWDKGNLLLFVLLYFAAACIKKNEEIIRKYAQKWFLLWLLMVLLLIFSAVIISGLSSQYSFFSGKELILYQYASPLVVIEAVSLFSFFLYLNRKITVSTTPLLIKWLCKSSLFIYVLHMHPVFKVLYTKYAVLRFINVSSASYFIWVTVTVLMIVFVGTVLTFVLLKPVSKCLEQFLHRLLLRLNCFE